MVVCKEGYRFIQGLIPAKIHKEFSGISKKMGQSRAETLRKAIECYLKQYGGKKNASDN